MLLRNTRQGISLIETLVAMFVLTIGLTSLAALIPAGRSEVIKANTEDRKAVQGISGIQELKTRGMMQATRWSYGTGPLINNGTLAVQPPYCIDPLGVAAGLPNVFPYAPNKSPTMARLSILSADNKTPWGRELAEAVFMSHDNLNIIPDENDDQGFSLHTKEAYQVMEPLTGTPLKRSFGFTDKNGVQAGIMSWMYTVTHSRDNQDLYNVALVVFSPRVIVNDGFSERSLTITKPGISGGDVVLTGTTPDQVGKIKSGTYLLVSGISSGNVNGAAISQSVFAWYLIRNIADADPSSSTRAATLQGRDWPLDVTPSAAHYCDGVIGVYEKTVRWEGMSLFPQ